MRSRILCIRNASDQSHNTKQARDGKTNLFSFDANAIHVIICQFCQSSPTRSLAAAATANLYQSRVRGSSSMSNVWQPWVKRLSFVFLMLVFISLFLSPSKLLCFLFSHRKTSVHISCPGGRHCHRNFRGAIKYAAPEKNVRMRTPLSRHWNVRSQKMDASFHARARIAIY